MSVRSKSNPNIKIKLADPLISKSPKHQTCFLGWLCILLVTCFISACFSNPPEVFDANKSKLLTAEQKAKMDIEFFNVLVVRTRSREESTSEIGSSRGDIVRRLAEQGFELAWLAEKFYDFYHFRYKRVEHGDVYWQRIVEMADNGDASAQCFIPLAVTNFGPNSNFKFPKLTPEQQNHYMKKAVAQKHPECLSSSGHLFQTGDEFTNQAKNGLYGAEKGCASCQSKMSYLYRFGRGVGQDYSKALCWAKEATLASNSVRYAYSYRRLKSRMDRNYYKVLSLKTYKPNTNCKEIQ